MGAAVPLMRLLCQNPHQLLQVLCRCPHRHHPPPKVSLMRLRPLLLLQRWPRQRETLSPLFLLQPLVLLKLPRQETMLSPFSLLRLRPLFSQLQLLPHWRVTLIPMHLSLPQSATAVSSPFPLASQHHRRKSHRQHWSLNPHPAMLQWPLLMQALLRPAGTFGSGPESARGVPGPAA